MSRRFSIQSLRLRVLLCTILFGSLMCHGQSGGVAEYDVKATFLYDFARFVDWPANTTALNRSPFVLCIVGTDPFGSALDRIVRGQRIDQHEIVIRRLSNLDDLTICQIAFVSRAENKNLSGILNRLKGSSTLVVGDAQDFARRGGGIQLYLEDNAVHFSINVDAVQRSHLAISSNVLALAKIVHDIPSEQTN